MSAINTLQQWEIADLIPVLQTPRLTLRGHVLDDFDPALACGQIQPSLNLFPVKPSSREESWSRLLRYCGHWQMLGFGYWVVENTETKSFLGEVGFADYKRTS